MNTHINDIMKLLKVSKETAIEVFDNMQIDFSECSNREFNAEAKAVYQAIKMSA